MQLKNRIFVLEHQKVDVLNTAADKIDQKAAGAKRKRNAPAPNARAKKQKTEETSEEKHEQQVIIERLMFEIPQSGCVYSEVLTCFTLIVEAYSYLGATLLRIYYLLQLSTSDAPPQPASLSQLVIEFAAAARHLISSIELSKKWAQNADRHCTTSQSQAETSQVTPMLRTTEDEAACKLEPLARLFTLVISRLHHIEISDDHTRQDTPSIIPAIFSLFQHLVEHIISLARKSGASSPPSTTIPKTKAFRRVSGRFAPRFMQDPPTQPPASAPASTTLNGTNPRNPNILALANLFIHMLSNIVNIQDKPQLGLLWSHITEYISNLLITRVASFLSLMVFGTSPPTQLFAAPVQLPLLKGSDEERKAQECEATWLLYLLEGSLPLMASQSKLSAGEDNACQSLSLSEQQANRKIVIGPAKRKLQNTLLCALFGSSAPDFEDALDMRVNLDVPLNLPLPPHDEGHGAANGKNSMSEWFKSEVWRIVGWRLLRGWD